MLSKNYLNNSARKIYKKTINGPGKFGIFILICIIIVFSFESLGLSNKEKNLEIRTVNEKVIPVKTLKKKIKKGRSLEKQNSNALNEKIKIVSEMDLTKRIIERENILLSGAIEQNLYENNINHFNFKNSNYQEKLVKLNNIILENSLSGNIKYANEDFFFDA